MNSFKVNLLLVALVLVFTQGLWERLFFFTPYVGYLIDAVIVIFIAYNFKISQAVPGLFLFCFYCLFGFFIGYLNSNSITESFFYLRYVIYFFLIFAQLYSSPISSRSWTKILKSIVFLLLLQGVGAIFNLAVLGVRIEGHVGLMSSLGGTTATVFPLMVAAVISLIYLYSPVVKGRTAFLYLMIVLGVFLVGYQSEKRTIYFIIPLFLLFTIFLSMPKLISRSFFKKKLIGYTLISILFFPALIYGIVSSKGFSYALKGNESNLEILTNAIQYGESYETSTNQYGLTIGRSNTSTQIISASTQDSDIFLTGLGYGSVKDEYSQFQMGFGYGVVGFTRDIVSAGWIAAILLVILFLTLIFRNKSNIKSPFNTALRFLLAAIFIYAHFFYSADFTGSLKVSFLLAIVLAVLNSPKQRHINIYFHHSLLKIK